MIAKWILLSVAKPEFTNFKQEGKEERKRSEVGTNVFTSKDSARNW